MTRYLASCLAALFAAPASAATNLIVNGSFETPAISNASFREIDSIDLLPWIIPNGSMLLGSDGAIANSPIVLAAQDGRQFMDIMNPNGSGSPLRILQDVTLSAGQSYELSFWLGNIDATGAFANASAGPARLRLNLASLSGDTILDQRFSNSASIVDRIDWARQAVRFAGFNGTLRVSFYADLANNDQFAGLDNVSLVATPPFPEPGTWALLIAGLGFTGTAMRTQRKSRPRNPVPVERETVQL